MIQSCLIEKGIVPMAKELQIVVTKVHKQEIKIVPKLTVLRK